MSHIAFESGQGRVEIGGRERARMGVLIDDLAWVMHSRGDTNRGTTDEYHQRLRWQNSGMFGGADNFAERLGWVCLIGDDVTKLLAHIHGQCEIHGWVHPDDMEWFADLVTKAVERGLLTDDGRDFYGSWAEVAALARRSTTALVSSYSVCDSWPDPELIARDRPDLWTPADPDDPYESWGELSDEDVARIADEAIADCAPRWHPAEWGTHWAEAVQGRSPWTSATGGDGA